MLTTPLMIEQHFHGAFGINFNTAQKEDILFVADKMLEHGVGGFFPTLVTDSVENIQKQIAIIKEASLEYSRILGIHLEGIFLNPEKKGIHNPKHFLPLAVKDYKEYQRDLAKGRKGDKAAARRVEKQDEKTMYACGGKSKKKKN